MELVFVHMLHVGIVCNHVFSPNEYEFVIYLHKQDFWKIYIHLLDIENQMVYPRGTAPVAIFVK